MTISTEIRKAGPFEGNDSTTVFPFAFKVFKAADVFVVRRNEISEIDQVLVLNTDYTITLNADQNATPGGSVTLVSGALASNFSLVISSDLPLLQETDLTNQGGFYPKVITNALDRLTIFCQQLSEKLGRALTLPITTPAGVSTSLPFPTPGNVIGWDSSATNLRNYNPQDIATVVAYGDTFADQFVGDGSTSTFTLSRYPGSINNLDVSVAGVTKRPIYDYIWDFSNGITFASPPPAPGVPGTKNILIRYAQALPQNDNVLREELASSSGASLVSWLSPLAMALQKKLSERFQSAFVVDFATEYLTMAEIEQIKIDYATGTLDQKPTVDITARLIQAIADLGGSHDITSAYLYEPAKVLQLPAGAMGLNLDAMARVLVDRNNVNIIGRGMFNTRLCHIGTGHANEMIRFKEAYACGLAHLTLDGGLPFTPVGTETYGADIPLVLDQCAHFYSEGLNVCNYRHRGIQCIHLWESYLGNDLRAFNGGWFRVAGSVPGGLFFDDFRKESTFFPGSESNQVYIGKYAFSGNGSVIQFKSPCFNMRINQVVSEARTYGAYVPPGIDSPKVVVSGLSSGIVVDQAWYYFHDQDAAAVGAGATLFSFENAGPGCYFNNQVVYQEIPAGSSGRALEVSKLIANSSAHPVNLQMTVQDSNCTSSLWNASAAGSLILGDIYYRKDTARTIDDLMGAYGPANFVGRVTMSTGNFTGTPPLVYQYDGKASVRSAIDGGGSYDEYKCRAIANFNGNASGGGPRMQKGISVTRTSTGTYQAAFAQAMPDQNYCVNFAILKSAAVTDAIEIASMSPTSFSFVIRDAAGALHDSSTICISVFR